MHTLFTKVDYTISLLIEYIDMGIIGLPEIQRPFVWNTAKVRDLFDSMYKGFPVGYLLFWSTTNGGQAKQIGTNSKQLSPRLLIVDGQQRLTSLYTIIKGKPVLNEDYQEKKLSIAFRPKDAQFEVMDAAILRDPEFIPDISVIWDNSTSHIRFVNDFIKKLNDQFPLTKEMEDTISHNIDRLYDLQHYPFTALELSSNIDEEEVAKVFVRINSQGVKLNQADFILTLMSVFWDEGRKNLEGFSRDCKKPSTSGPSPFNYFIQPSPDQLLRVCVGLGFKRARLKYAYSILRGKDLQTEKYSDQKRIEQFEILKKSQKYSLDLTNWHEYLNCLKLAGFKSSSMISSDTGLIYSYVFYLMGKQEFKVDHFKLRKLIAKWFFMQAITRRYSSSPETIMEGDLARFREKETSADFSSVLDKLINDALTDDFWNITLVNDLSVSSATSPALFAYQASLVILDARVLFSNMKISEFFDPSIKKVKNIERHHLFPRNYLKKIGIKEIKETNQIANYAFVEWTDNIEISDKSPSEYLPQYLRRITPEEKNDLYYWHALMDNWENLDYNKFLEERRKRIAKIIRAGFEKLTQ